MTPSEELALIVDTIREDGDALPAMLARLDDLTDRMREIENSRDRCPPAWRGMFPKLVYTREVADACP